jgi:Zn-dependent protease
VTLALTGILGIAAWPSIAEHGLGLVLHRDIGALLAGLAVTNLLLALFNILPVFPMDGGRALHALVAARVGPVRAARLVAQFGQVFAVALVIVALALTGNVLLVLLTMATGALILVTNRQALAHGLQMTSKR